MNTSEFKFDYCANNTGLTISIYLDGQQLYCQSVGTEFASFVGQIPDDGNFHQIEICMSGKTPKQTVIDHQGNIVSDVLLQITNIEVDGIDISTVFAEKSTYTHDFNGSGDTVVDRFYGSMGCNGSVKLDFSTPFYLWLLENM